MFCNKEMLVIESEKYLGDMISSSLQESVFLTIQKRKGLALKLTSEIKYTVEDCRSYIVGGILSGIEIWNMAVMPFLFANCETWMEIPKKLHPKQVLQISFCNLQWLPFSCILLGHWNATGREFCDHEETAFSSPSYTSSRKFFSK